MTFWCITWVWILSLINIPLGVFTFSSHSIENIIETLMVFGFLHFAIFVTIRLTTVHYVKRFKDSILRSRLLKIMPEKERELLTEEVRISMNLEWRVVEKNGDRITDLVCLGFCLIEFAVICRFFSSPFEI
jgi:hypothetical protein